MKKYLQIEKLAAASRWLVALGRPDADAWERAEEARDELDSSDPVRLAIEHCLEPEAPERKARSNAALAYTAERARSEPHAFDRVMIEMTGRFSFPTARAEVLDRCIAICEHRLGEVEDSSAELEASRALLGLALAYRSSEHSRVSQQYEAEWLMERALANLDAPEGEPVPALDPLRREILARVLELRADHFASHGDHAKCQQILEEVGPLLADCEMPGRSASVWWQAGRSSVRTRDYEHAVSMLEAAQRDLPPGLDQNLQCHILYFRAFAEASQGHFTVAAQSLAQAEPLAGKAVALDLQVQQRLLLGLEASIDGRTREAKLHCLSAVRLALEEAHLGAAFAALKVMALRNLLGVEDALKLVEVVPLPEHEKYWARLLLEASRTRNPEKTGKGGVK